ncbi:MAG: neutral zinc metallopeptidase [Pelomonas sp.]|nr:neutral zinc metallopeptidase [Roseateles sp.]
MQWEGERESDNVDDVRGDSGGGGIGVRHVGIGGIVVALLVSWLFGLNPLTVLGLMQGGGGAQLSAPAPRPAAPGQTEDKEFKFVRVVLASTEDVWGAYFAEHGQKYPPPRLEVFRGRYPTACGMGAAAMGPFYCPGDRKVYLDLDFFDTLDHQLGAPGVFPRAYVVAHEVGHHIQNLLGTTAKVDAARQRLSETQYNALSVRLELQADCYAGVWAARAEQSKHWLGQGDVEAALNAAAQIGDDTLQRHARGTVVPESFTHGTSAQRVNWLKRGMARGDPADCDTFGAKTL